MTPRQVCGASWRKPVHQITDRAKRYRAHQPECRPPGPAKCALCAGHGVRTRQFNPGASTLAQYTEAALQHTRGEHDAGGEIIHETPKEKRQEFAAEIWRRRRARGTDRHQ